MLKRQMVIIIGFSFLPAVVSFGIEKGKAGAFAGRDLHIAGGRLLSTQGRSGEHILVFEDGFSMSFGPARFSSDKAVVSLECVTVTAGDRIRRGCKAKVYLKGQVDRSILSTVGKRQKGRFRQFGIESRVIEAGQVEIVWFDVGGEVFVTSEATEIGDVRGLELYKQAAAGFEQIPTDQRFVVQPGAVVPEADEYRKSLSQAKKVSPRELAKEVVEEQTMSTEVSESVEQQPVKVAPEPAQLERKTEQVTMYPVNIAPAGAAEPQIESMQLPDGTSIATVIGRFYLWQKQDEAGGLLELQADNAVVYYDRQRGSEQLPGSSLGEAGAVTAIYMSGDVVMTQGQRVILADEMYYDFRQKKALAINGVMRNFDVKRGIPIYIHAARIRQVAENEFSAEDITLTSSEFYRSQISLTVSKVYLVDMTGVDEQAGEVSDSSYDARLYDLRMKLGDMTIFYWPYMRSNLQRPDLPLKSIRLSRDSDWGTTIETRWYLARLLGLRQPRGTESTLAVDYFEKRGVGVGGEISYSREKYFGRALGYVIRDSGDDDLGRHYTRRNVEPPDELRGRFSWQHRHFLPYNWQLMAGIGYASDENFIEGFYRGEYNVGTNETYVHMKRLEENWGVSILTKGRINDFADELEELPSTEYHLTGQSLLGDRLTLYSDTQVSRLRQRIGDKHSTLIDENMFSFVSHRTELDAPLRSRNLNIVPFVAGTFGYDDRSGFTRSLVDGSNTGRFGEDKIWFGELGVRVFAKPLWKVYPDIESRLWDLNGLRHIIKPYVTAVAYKENDSVIKQRDTAIVGISQRLQTKRGEEDKRQMVDWMRLDMDVVWVNDSVSATQAGPGPDRFIWSRPIVPLRVFSTPGIYSGDLIDSLHRFDMYGPRRNYFSTDYMWRVSDTSAIFSDMNFDMQSGVVQQFNVGLSRFRWPNLSYYIGSRYLKRINVLDEKGSNALTFSATYKIDERYTAVFSQQYDFDYAANIRSEIVLIRKYHRMFMSLTYSADESLKRQAIVFSIWPEGIPELAFGQRRYMRLGGASGY